MKNIANNIFYILLTAFVVMGCTKDFEEINKDPNEATSVPTAYLLTNAQRGLIGQRPNNTGMLYIQHWSQTQYTNASRYETAESSFNGFYRGHLFDLQQIINLNTDEETRLTVVASGSNNNQIAVARILKVFSFQIITDTWGEIPYSQALKGAEKFTPEYDTQDAIYADFVKELTEAVDQIDVNAPGVEGDIIFGGDMAAWIKFANALKMRVGIRMTNSNPGLAEAAVTSGLAGAFESNDDNALYAYLSDAANDNPIYQHFLTRTDWAVSNTLVDYMNDVNDPRLPIYADPAPETETIVGMPYGVSEAIAGSITNDAISFPGIAVREATSPGILMTYSEVLFIKAEAAARGWISDDAASIYQEAITASMEYWGVETADIDTYLAQGSVAYDAGNFAKSIGEQKWLSLYMNGAEAWAEWRRLDYPQLLKAPDAVEGREIPRRRAYTQDEFNLNNANYLKAVERQGADEFETRVWWDQ